jgi:hypothetical protein
MLSYRTPSRRDHLRRSYLMRLAHVMTIDERGTDTTPTAVEEINSPLHVLVLVGMGIPLIENLDLDRLASF